MNASRDADSEGMFDTQIVRINRLCNQLEAGWRAGHPPALEQVLLDLTAADRAAALRDLLPLEIEYRQLAGETVSPTDYMERFPEADRDWLASVCSGTHANHADDGADLQPSAVLGDYQIIDRIGGGGMGTVYKALHVRMGREVALKILRPEIRQNPRLLQRFHREVRAAARLSHPNIVAAFDAREQAGLHFLITEFISGLDLEQTVRRQGRLPVAEAVDCVVQVARGLDYAHRQGVVHRDIKPANLVRDQQGVIKILDMGLARLDRDPGSTASELTNSGMVLGTAAYMAPEQARDVRQADLRSDIYSLGCTFYYLLTGRQAFTGATALDTVLSHLSQPIPRLSSTEGEFPRELEEIFARMVAKDPADRYQTAAEIVVTLERLMLAAQNGPADDLKSTEMTTRQGSVSDAGLPTVSLTVAERDEVSRNDGPRASRRLDRRWWLGAAGLLVLLAAIDTVLSVFRKRGPVPQPIPRFALQFNGTSSYVSAPSLKPSAGGSYTLEAIVVPTGGRQSNVISWLGPDWMALYFSDGKWGLARYFQEASHLIVTLPPAQLDKAVHLAGIFQGGELQLYIDGKRATSQKEEFGLAETSGGLYIGGVDPRRLPAGQNVRFFEGQVRSVRISRGVRYNANFPVPNQMESDSQTLALYRFSAGQGPTVIDESGHGHEARIHDATWVVIE